MRRRGLLCAGCSLRKEAEDTCLLPLKGLGAAALPRGGQRLSTASLAACEQTCLWRAWQQRLSGQGSSLSRVQQYVADMEGRGNTVEEVREDIGPVAYWLTGCPMLKALAELGRRHW